MDHGAVYQTEEGGGGSGYIAQGNEIEMGTCLSCVRDGKLTRPLKLFTKSRQQYKDDRDRVPIFQEFTSLVGEKNKYIRIQEKL